MVKGEGGGGQSQSRSLSKVCMGCMSMSIAARRVINSPKDLLTWSHVPGRKQEASYKSSRTYVHHRCVYADYEGGPRNKRRATAP